LKNYFGASRIHRASTIALALIPGAHILTVHGIMSDSVLLKKPEIFLFYYSSIIGLAFSMAFFAPLWSRLSLATEGEFLLWRFQGAWASHLHVMRSVMMSFIVVPLGMSLILSPLHELLTGALAMEPGTVMYLLAALLLISAFINSFPERMRMDRTIGATMLLLLPALLYLCISGLRSLDPKDLQGEWQGWTGRISAIDVIVPALVIWWFAHVIDLPTMTGQKLLASRNERAGSRGAVLASMGIVLVGGIFLSMPLSLGYTPEQGDYFTFLRTKLHGGPWLWVVTVFYLGSGILLLLNLQHWAGALIDANVIKHHTRLERTKGTAWTAMLISSFVGFMLLVLNDSTLESYWSRLLISAGVGPVFILRWYLPRVTAQVQFTAMIAAIVFTLIWYSIMATDQGLRTMEQLALEMGLEDHLLQLLFIGLGTLAAAALPYWKASETDIAHGRERIREIHGGPARIMAPLVLALALCAINLLITLLPTVIGLLI
jgi:solute:Na+ symporter, SSS family